MKIYFKKFSMIFVMTFAIILGCCTSVFAADDTYTENLVPTMTSNSNPSGRVTYSSFWNYDWTASQAFDKKINNFGWCTSNDCPTGWLAYEFDAPKTVAKYSIAACTVQNNASPKSWSFEGSNDGLNWNILDERTGEINWKDNEKRIYLFNNSIAYKIYRINIKESNNSSYCVISELEMMGKIQNNIESITLNQSTLELPIDISKQLTSITTPAGAQLEWSSSDKSIAAVDANGKVTGIKEGQAIISAQIKDTDIKAICIVTVTKKNTPIEPEQPTDSEYIINTANAKGDNTNNASGSVSIKFNGTAETTLSVVKTADVKEVWVGDTFTYTIVVTNTGSKAAKAVVINDSAPNHIDFIVDRVTTTKGKIDESSTSKNIVINVGDIEPSETVTIKIPVNVVA
ncbi:MAG: Ig-like domain-containing protein [Clostridium butyricum]|nr:Ig-like domain-containing protein [Clostridium butyricum]